MIFFVFLLGFFGIFGAARWVMFTGLQQCALLCLIFVLCFNLRLAILPLGGAALASALMTACVVVTVFFNLVDAAITEKLHAVWTRPSLPIPISFPSWPFFAAKNF